MSGIMKLIIRNKSHHLIHRENCTEDRSVTISLLMAKEWLTETFIKQYSALLMITDPWSSGYDSALTRRGVIVAEERR